MKKVLVILLAFLLTGTLLLFSACLIVRQELAPAMRENGAGVSDEMIARQKELILARVDALAEQYSFNPVRVTSKINDTGLRDLNTQASMWWKSLITEGKITDDVSWQAIGLESALQMDLRKQVDPEDEEGLANLVAQCAAKVRESVVRVVLPLRQNLVRFGLKKAGEYADLANIILFFVGMPWAALALSALLAGLIALLESRVLRRSLAYIGSAMGAAALTAAAVVVLVLRMDILPLVHEASPGLELEVRSILSGTALRTGILISALAAGCVLCLLISRTGKEKA